MVDLGSGSQPITIKLAGSPWVRLTYLFDDGDSDRLGFATVVLSCLKCGGSQLLTYKAPVPIDQVEEVYGEHGDPAARHVRDLYEQAHQHPEPSSTRDRPLADPDFGD